MREIKNIEVNIFRQGNSLYIKNVENGAVLEITESVLFVYNSGDKYRPFHPVEYYNVLLNKLKREGSELNGILITGNLTGENNENIIDAIINIADTTE